MGREQAGIYYTEIKLFNYFVYLYKYLSIPIRAFISLDNIKLFLVFLKDSHCNIPLRVQPAHETNSLLLIQSNRKFKCCMQENVCYLGI